VAAVMRAQERGRKILLFVNKKKQKNFIRWQPALRTGERHVTTVFLLLFFQKKKTLASLCLLRPSR
jgi:hypothetical protein